METRKLYYEDCHRAEFDATVRSCVEADGKYWVALDQTAFYPEGGGQAADTGSLGDAKVLHTKEEGETVLHLCDKALEVGSTVTGRIDYGPRFDRMQQHTGEHILSGLVFEKYGFHNTGFHMGADSVTVDFDGIIPTEDLQDLERRVNEALWQDIPLKIWTPSPEELPSVFYRTKRALPWPVRIVQIPGYDSCACCGVHVARTGEVGLAKLLSCVRFRTGVRIEMLCGRQALEFLSRSHEQNTLVSRAFSANLMETGDAAQRMNETVDGLKARIGELQRQIFASIAEKSAGQGNVRILREDLDAAGVRNLADLVADSSGGTAAVFSGSDTAGYSYCLMSRMEDLRPLGKAMNEALNGRGGGKAGFQQGSVKALRKEIEAFFASFAGIQ